MPPPDRKPLSSNIRVLDHKDAKILAQTGRLPTKNAPASSPVPPRAPSSAPESPGPSLARKRHLHSFFSNFRQRCAALPRPVRLMGRGARALIPLIPISLFFSEHVLQIMWVKGPSMTPYLNEDYDQMQTKSDMVLVNMWSMHRLLPWKDKRRLERGMVVTFRYGFSNPESIHPQRIARTTVCALLRSS
jgi:inner membrane protease subunit 2